MIRTSHSVSIGSASSEACVGNQSISEPERDAEHRRDQADREQLLEVRCGSPRPV